MFVKAMFCRVSNDKTILLAWHSIPVSGIMFLHSNFSSEIAHFSLLLNLLLKYSIQHVSIGLFNANFIFKIMIFYSGVPDFATDGLCGVWCHGLTTCFLYVGPLAEN